MSRSRSSAQGQSEILVPMRRSASGCVGEGTFAVSSKQLTESDLLLMLRARVCGAAEGKNGDAAAFLTHVRNQTGFAHATVRHADAISLGLWPSRGMLLEGYEVKCSRSDWKRELDRPEKADPFFRYCDRWWLVVADEKIVHPGELPEPWGLLAVKGKGLRCITEAPKHKAKPINRTMLAGLLRSAVRIGDSTPEEVQAAANQAREREASRWKLQLELAENRAEKAQAAIDAFQRASGVQLDLSGNGYYGQHDPAEVGRALRLVLDGEVQLDRMTSRAERIAESAETLAADARKLIPTQPKDSS